MPLGDDDLVNGVFFSDFAVSVFFGAQSTKGNLDAPGKDAIFDRASVSDSEYRLELAAVSLNPFPAVKDTLNLMGGQYGGAYKVSSVNPIDDGAIVEIKMRRL